MLGPITMRRVALRAAVETGKMTTTLIHGGFVATQRVCGTTHGLIPGARQGGGGEVHGGALHGAGAVCGLLRQDGIILLDGAGHIIRDIGDRVSMLGQAGGQIAVGVRNLPLAQTICRVLILPHEQLLLTRRLVEAL